MESAHKLTVGSLCLVSLTAIAGIINPAHPVISSIITGTSGAIASVVANAFDKLTEPEKLSLQNQDLPKVIGKAIGKIIEEVASESKWGEYKSELQEFAKNSPENWLKIITEADKDSAPTIITESLRKNFNQKKSEKKDAEKKDEWFELDWENIVKNLYKQTFANKKPESWKFYQRPKEFTPDLINYIAQKLQERFRHALTEALKHDFANDGKAYAALTLNLLTDIQGKFAENQDEHKEILENINNLAELLKINDPEKIKKFFQEIFGKISSDLIDDYLSPVKKTVENTQENSERILETVVSSDSKLDFLIKIVSPIDPKSDNSVQKTTSSENESFDINFEENENLCFQEIDDGRQMIIRIKAPENMGKNTLVKKIEEYAREKQYLTVRLDFWLPTEETLKDYSKFLQWCSNQVVKKLRLTNINANDYWNSNKDAFDDNSIFDMFLDTNVFDNINKKILVVILSSLDQVFTLDFAPKFFKMLRSWQQTNRWENLRLVLSHSTECYLNLNLDSASSPFNVGLKIELDEFTKKQIEELAKKRRINLDDEQINKIMLELGGHPYLIDTILSNLKAKNTKSKFQALMSFQSLKTVFKRELIEVYNKLKNKSELLKLVRNLLEQEPLETKTEEEKILFMLESIGLIIKKEEQNETINFRNNLYRQYFKQELLKTEEK